MPPPTLQELQSDLAAAIRDRDDYSAQARIYYGEAAAQDSIRQRQPFLMAARQNDLLSASMARAVCRLTAQIAGGEQPARAMVIERAALTAEQHAAVDETFGYVRVAA